MTKCPFCQYENEDGALFCEQCKSDLGVMEPSPSSASPPGATTAGSEEATEAVETMAIPVANPVRSENVRETAAVGPIPVARPVTQDAAISSHADIPTAWVAESSLESPPTTPFIDASPDTVGSVKTYVPQGESHKLSEKGPADSDPPTRSTSPISRDTDILPTGGKPALLVLRGQKISVEYPIYEGHNFIGRADEKPVDIDLEDQEPPDRIWSSRQHALIRLEEGILVIEDLNSSNGTFINRTRLYPGQKRVLNANDIIQIGTVQMKVIVH
jgi:hypothetical protein